MSQKPSEKSQSASPRASWTTQLVLELLNIVAEETRDGSVSTKKINWKKVCEDFRRKARSDIVDAKIQSKFQELKQDFRLFSDLKSIPGMEYDSLNFRLLCGEKKWKEIIAVRQEAQKFRSMPFVYYDKMKEMMHHSSAAGEDVVATTHAKEKSIETGEQLVIPFTSQMSSSSSSSLMIDLVKPSNLTATQHQLPSTSSPTISPLSLHSTQKTTTIQAFIATKTSATPRTSSKRKRNEDELDRLTDALHMLAPPPNVIDQALRLVDEEFKHLLDEDILKVKTELSNRESQARLFVGLSVEQRKLFVNAMLK